MKLSCLQENLSKGLGIVGRAVATKTTLPTTQNVLIATDQSQLKLSATNLEMAISCWVGAKVEEDGAITIPARLLTEFINSLPTDDKVAMALSGNTLELKCGRYQARINGIAAGEFPPIPQITDGISTTIESEALRHGITHVGFAAATEESRPVLTGVHTEFEESKLTLAAADGFRLAVHYTSVLSPVKEKTAVIVPARALNELGRFAIDHEDPVEITVNKQKSQVMFKLKNIEMVSQIIQGTFPNYSQLIPQSYETRAVIDVAEFLRATRMSSIFARDGSGIVRLIITPSENDAAAGKVAVSARAEEIGDNVGEVDALVDGNDAKIAFNARYLTDVLGVLRQSQVALETTTPSSPGVIRPVGVDNYVHVVMPMFVQW
jgi:DNA polymerase III subunit beta